MEHMNNDMNQIAKEYDLSSVHKIKILEADVSNLLKHLNLKSVDCGLSCSSFLLSESFCNSDKPHQEEKAPENAKTPKIRDKSDISGLQSKLKIQEKH